ncbi:TIGR03619 family F420-dependent LLM class oxidoreductase [Nocardia sp. CA-135953]|uniref:TIGR03619 family F420-dependent LLM class oxidoreductase n=1 Tax=Nocardia sp. CA-135953 TaxID=3239978 RepID=UPI003D972FFC
MKFGMQLFPWERWPDFRSIGPVVRTAEEVGFDGVALSDHIAPPRVPEAAATGKSRPEIYVLAAHLAALTERIRLVFYATVVPYRGAVHQAKLAATLDQVSNGRFTMVVGTGWLEAEFDALQVSFADRGDITDEYCRAMITLWTQEEPTFAGKHVRFEPLTFEPKCVQRPHIPLWIAGSGRRPLRRLVEFGSGWTPMVGDVPTLARQVAAAKDAVRAAGRDADALDFAFGISFGEPDRLVEKASEHVGESNAERMAGSRDQIVDLVGRYQEAGFTYLSISSAWDKPSDLQRKLEWFAENVMPQFR